jgi:Holliday junction resolvase RusA-like endonuclease
MGISFTIPVLPVSLQNSGRKVMVMGGRPVFYKAKEAKDWIAVVGYYANPHAPKQPIQGPIRMAITFVMKRPVSLNAKNFSTGRIPYDQRPDTDNMCKCLTDALNGFWEDDAQITELHASKWYAAKTEQPKIVITIESINENPIHSV